MNRPTVPQKAKPNALLCRLSHLHMGTRLTWATRRSIRETTGSNPMGRKCPVLVLTLLATLLPVLRSITEESFILSLLCSAVRGYSGITRTAEQRSPRRGKTRQAAGATSALICYSELYTQCVRPYDEPQSYCCMNQSR